MICRCGRPTRDQAYVCDECSHVLAVALGEIPWLEVELETTITHAKGVDYRTKGGTQASERPSPVMWAAAEARDELKAVLVSWVLFCRDERVRHQSPARGLPADGLSSVSRWLLWRVDGLALVDIGTDAVEEITTAVDHCRRLIDRPAEKQYLGPCAACETGRLYARPGSAWARCESCDEATDAEGLRKRLIDSLDDRLCTAAEIARLSTYLGLRANRDQVRNRINQWHARKQIQREASFSDEATFRFGIVWRLLCQEDATKAS